MPSLLENVITDDNNAPPAVPPVHVYQDNNLQEDPDIDTTSSQVVYPGEPAVTAQDLLLEASSTNAQESLFPNTE